MSNENNQMIIVVVLLIIIYLFSCMSCSSVVSLIAIFGSRFNENISGILGDDVSGILGDDVSGILGDDVSGILGDDVSGILGDRVSGNGYKFYENVFKMGNDQQLQPQPHSAIDDNGCVNNINVESAAKYCNPNSDCEGFFVYDSKNKGRVCFKTNIDTDNKTYAADVFQKDNPNCGYFVKQ